MTQVMTLRVLGYRDGEEGCWAAHCLETDLVGRGTTFEKALSELQELTEMQVSFAAFKGQPALLDHPAPHQIFELYNLIATERLRTFPKPPVDPTRAVGSLSLREMPGPPNLMAWAHG